MSPLPIQVSNRCRSNLPAMFGGRAVVRNEMHCCLIVSAFYADDHVVLKLQLNKFVRSASSGMLFCSERIGRKSTPQYEAAACISVVGQISAEVGLDQPPQSWPPCLTLSEPAVSYQFLLFPAESRPY